MANKLGAARFGASNQIQVFYNVIKPSVFRLFCFDKSQIQIQKEVPVFISWQKLSRSRGQIELNFQGQGRNCDQILMCQGQNL